MAIVLMILKIIGITILAILGLLVLLLFVVLFDPIGYKVEGFYQESYELKASVHWLFHILSIRFIFSKDEKHLFIRLFGIKIMDLLKPKDEKRTAKKKVSSISSKADEEIEEIVQSPDNKDEHAKQLKEAFWGDDSMDLDPDATGFDVHLTMQETNEQDGTESMDSDNATIFDRLSSKLQQFVSNVKKLCTTMMTNLQDVLQSLRDSASKASEAKEKAGNKIRYIQNWIYVLSLDKTKVCIEAAKEEAIKLLLHILPRKWKMHCHFGFDDPATTGLVLGYYWMFTAICMDHMTCVPDFEQQVIEVKGFAKGRIQLFKLAIVAYKFFFDKKFKYLRRLKKRVDAMKG